jgi:SpoVK/Ycf46/Vps4 family AAA+-type ATPase
VRMDMPQSEDRFHIMKEHLDHVGSSVSEQDLVMISRATSGFVSSDLAQIIRNSHLLALR